MPRLPKHPWPFWLLALALAASSGHRAIDFMALSMIVDPLPAHADNGLLIGAAVLPIFAVPAAIVFCFVSFRNYPSPPPRLFDLDPRSASQILGTLIFGAIAIIWLFIVYEKVRVAYLLPQHDLGEYRLDTTTDAVCSAGVILLLLCGRAAICARSSAAAKAKQL